MLEKVQRELEAAPELRQFGSGWLSGTIALIAAIAGLALVIVLRLPGFFSMPELKLLHESGGLRVATHVFLLLAYGLALLNLILRPRRVLGFAALGIALLAGLLGGSHVESSAVDHSNLFFGLDFFVVNVLFTGFLFIPLERLLPRKPEQHLFRAEWREDLLYYLVSSMFVQVLTFLTMAPSTAILQATGGWSDFRALVGRQPWVLQVAEIMVLTDFVQYWLHRAFHRVPFLWGFHAVHHSAKSMDWMAGARMHFLEIITLRSSTAIPMFTLGYDPSALQAYVLLVYVYSSLIHANVRGDFDRFGKWMVTPRFHHWHHGIEAAAIDVNFAIHFPVFDRLFGTFYLPKGAWPIGYGVSGHPVPQGYWRQFFYPFRRKQA
jgi:sterol desaturase/sphingolipid hydroxylase (fatty acid hydroxylase superfamily)